MSYLIIFHNTMQLYCTRRAIYNEAALVAVLCVIINIVKRSHLHLPGTRSPEHDASK